MTRPIDRITSSAPAKIYLDIPEDAGFDPDTVFKDFVEVTWSEDCATGVGIPYIRADMCTLIRLSTEPGPRLTPTPAASRAATPSVTEAMVEAYLVAQRRAVEEADRFGRPNVGGLHTNTVREACRAGIVAALEAAQPASPAPLTYDQIERTAVACGWHPENARKADLASFARAIAALASPQVAPTISDARLLEIGEMREMLGNIAARVLSEPRPLEFCRRIDAELAALIAAPAPVAPQDDARDAARLDFLIEREAFVTASKTRIDPTLKYQCWSRDEDEDYRYLSGEHEHFDTARHAIDAAIALSTPAAKPTEPTLPTQGDAK